MPHTVDLRLCHTQWISGCATHSGSQTVPHTVDLKLCHTQWISCCATHSGSHAVPHTVDLRLCHTQWISGCATHSGSQAVYRQATLCTDIKPSNMKSFEIRKLLSIEQFSILVKALLTRRISLYLQFSSHSGHFLDYFRLNSALIKGRPPLKLF